MRDGCSAEDHGMMRRLLNLASGLSLLLCISTVVLWVRSDVTVDRILVKQSAATRTELVSMEGGCR